MTMPLTRGTPTLRLRRQNRVMKNRALKNHALKNHAVKNHALKNHALKNQKARGLLRGAKRVDLSCRPCISGK
ncbi:hypothetical protein HDN1F_25440 [gamma proteobacterium HdN1]|nr:hypothetical protein HDN1F_25440 [gamma proteobacterium HdN1]